MFFFFLGLGLGLGLGLAINGSRWVVVTVLDGCHRVRVRVRGLIQKQNGRQGSKRSAKG